jgi:hypothetical protein
LLASFSGARFNGFYYPNGKDGDFVRFTLESLFGDASDLDTE